jgi:hypothetical protein
MSPPVGIGKLRVEVEPHVIFVLPEKAGITGKVELIETVVFPDIVVVPQ